MDPPTRDFDQWLFCIESPWESYIKTAGTEGSALCGITPDPFCCLLASSASEGRTGTFFAASVSYVRKSFLNISLFGQVLDD